MVLMEEEAAMRLGMELGVRREDVLLDGIDDEDGGGGDAEGEIDGDGDDDDNEDDED